MSWKRVNLFDCLGREVFMDEYGFCRLDFNGILINDLSTSDLFKYNESNKRYERFRFGQSGDYSKELESLFNLDLAKSKKMNQPYYGYSYGNDILSPDQATKVKVNKVTISLNTHYYAAFGNNGGVMRQENVSDTIELESPKDIKKYSCWFEKGTNYSSFKMVVLPETKVEDEFYLVGVGKVKVSEMMKYPNKDDAVCEVVDSEGKKHCVKMSSEVFYLPYNKTFDEYEILNQSIEELKLSPYVVRNNEPNHIYNVYWNKIEEACCYHVVLYKFIEVKNAKRILQIADYEIDRNTCYLALDKLAGKDFVFKVKAEDRNGNIIAESRGVASGRPQFFKK